jgi:spermidine synthase
MKVGVVGLGAGTLACSGRPCDLYRFYEINPQVVSVATDPRLFTYLPDANTPIDLVPGDARRMLEKERAAGDPLYDVLLVDAYSGDAVPYHLATREAFRLYFDRLAADGILAVHVSNWHIDLLPLCKAVAKDLGVVPYGVVSAAEDSVTSGAIWVLMARRPMTYRFPGKGGVREVVWEQIRDVAVPTDEKGSLIPLLRF